MLRRPGACAARALLVLAVATTGCGRDEGGEGAPTVVGGTASTTTAAAPGAGTTAETAAGPGGTSGGAPSRVGGSGSPPPTSAEPAALSPGGVGDLARALLGPGNGDRVVVEVRAQSGAAPARRAIDHVAGVLRTASGKTVVLDGVDLVSGGARAWTAASIVAAAEATAAHGQGGDQVVVRLLFLRGTFEGDASVLGVAVRGDVAAVFPDRVEAAASLLVPSATIEDAVTVHELGHLLGLVDLVVDTGRDDPSHPGHSTNDRSVMHWAVESDLVTQVLGGGVPTELDAQDRADLARIRAG